MIPLKFVSMGISSIQLRFIDQSEARNSVRNVGFLRLPLAEAVIPPSEVPTTGKDIHSVAIRRQASVIIAVILTLGWRQNSKLH